MKKKKEIGSGDDEKNWREITLKQRKMMVF